ncbi:hypothetical protein [Polaribacter sp. IC073]|uniref:hypothetical protein n=1 Tax=Polaribacter sp. IC073 TaxID=2508540 RepID=UPI0011BDA98A|nr:hypothetical protein [Polaribacter sp. IC073]TXD49152.1 hypothetical protein ES045_03545 [Polaribacter sp. IC073]
MHETLRSSFKLQKENAEWQRITSDSANNTFFSIYAKFYFKEDSFTPNSCDVKIQNYTGSITYGISNVASEIKFIYDKDIKDYVFFFTIKLKPLFANDEMTNISLEFKNLNHKHYKNTEPTSNFSSNHLMFVHLEYENHHKEELPIETNINDLNFIDQNHYLRDGDEIRGVSYIDYSTNNLYDPHDSPVKTELIIPVNGVKETVFYVTSRPCRDIYVRFF